MKRGYLGMSPVIIEQDGLSPNTIMEALKKFTDNINVSKVLLIPPDSTRPHSGAGLITTMFYSLFSANEIQVDILPALGTHEPMTSEQISRFFRGIPTERFITHKWRDGVTAVGTIPSSFVRDISKGYMNKPIPVEVSNTLIDKSYDLILSIGQVVPHEVAGMANYSKNIFVGCGGIGFINSSHMLGAYYGIEQTLGCIDTPVRKMFDYAEKNFLRELPLEYVLTVTESTRDKTDIIGLYLGGGRTSFERAAKLSQKRNIVHLPSPIPTCVVWLNEATFSSTWLGNKAIYRTRKAIADGGNLIILAPGVRSFGEDNENDRVIRKYGYIGRKRILSLCKSEKDLMSNLSAAAHLIHGSSDGRFSIIYAAPLLGNEAIESVGYHYMDFAEAVRQYDPSVLGLGSNIINGENIYFIPNPATGLWVC